MVKKWGVFCVIVLALIVAGCRSPQSNGGAQTPLVEDPSKTEEMTQEAEVQAENTTLSFLNGLPIGVDVVNRRPIAVMLDNQVKARPQAGLEQADIVIEALAEGEITRYFAVFQSKDPQTIGPVRSARPYFVDRALEYDAYYVHAGGSMAALADVRRLQVPDVDALHEGQATFWRVKHKKAPHNLYTNPAVVRNVGIARGYREEWKAEHLNFGNDPAFENGVAFTRVVMQFKAPSKSDSVGYTSTFEVQADGRMMRLVNNKPHKDETTEAQLYADTVIIQKVKYSTIDKEGRLKTDLVGRGEGYILSKGKYIAATWEKKSRSALTRYYDSAGKEIEIPTGIQWIELFPENKKIEFTPDEKSPTS